MLTKDIQYLNSINDASQYAVKRCKEGDNTFMFHCTTLQGSEVMNAANQEIRSRTVVCPVSATMLSIKFECHRFKAAGGRMGGNQRINSAGRNGVQ